MAFAEVVSRLARTNRMSVAAYAAATGTIRHDQRRVSGSRSITSTAATPLRAQATCQPVRLTALMAAPPVENNNAAPSS